MLNGRKTRYVSAATCVAVALAIGVWARPSPQDAGESRFASALMQRRAGARGGARRSEGKVGARAERRAERRAEKQEGRGSAIARGLRAAELTPAQRKSVLDIRDKHDARMRGFGRRIIEKRRELVDALEETVPNVARARVALGELTSTITEQVAARTEVELEVFRLLTPEQRARVRSFRDAQMSAKPRGGARDAVRPSSPPAGTEDDQHDDPLAGENEVLAPDAPRDTGSSSAPEGAEQAETQRIRPLLALDFTPEQRIKVRELRRKQIPAVRGVTARFREVRRALTEALLASTIDGDRVKQLGAELGRYEAERTQLRFDAEVDLLSIMTPDQVRRYRELRRERRRQATDRSPASGLDTP